MKLLEEMAKIEEMAEIDPDMWKEFESTLEELNAIVKEGGYDETPNEMDVIYDNLDKPIAAEIDNVVAGGNYVRHQIYAALEAGQYDQGTEPQAALDGAIHFMRMVIRKLKNK